MYVYLVIKMESLREVLLRLQCMPTDVSNDVQNLTMISSNFTFEILVPFY